MRRIVFLLTFFLFLYSTSLAKAVTLSCGQASPDTNDTCNCPASGGFQNVANTSYRCCGFYNVNANNGCSSTSPTSESVQLNLDNLNKAIFGGAPDASLTTPRGIIGRLLPYLLTFGGLILFIMLIWGGFEMLTGAANPKSQEAGKQRMTAAIIGFILLFASYWLAQLVQAIFGISIL